MKIWVDADACPKIIKETIYNVSNRLEIVSVFVANSYLNIPYSKFITFKQVNKGADVADQYIVEHVNNGDIVIDIGANIGTTAISLSRSVGETGKVYAFEPQQIMSQCLSANVLINNIKNIEVYTLAISSKSGWVYLDSDELSSKGRYGSVGVADKGHQVKAINMNEFKIKECGFIKNGVNQT